MGFVNVSPQEQSAHDEASISARLPRWSYELARALKSSDKAMIVCKLHSWAAHNQANKKGYRNGHYWTFSSLERWQAKEFAWLSVKQLGTLMAQLVKTGLLIRTRPSVHKPYWYRVNERVLVTLCPSLANVKPPSDKTAEQSDKTAGLTDQNAEQSDKTAEHKQHKKKQENKKQEESNTQTTTRTPARDDTEADAAGRDPAVVVVTPPRPNTKEAESGEHSINGEVSQNRKNEVHEGSFAFEDPISQHANDTALSKVPQKVLSPLVLELISIGILPTVSEPLIREYGEARVREVLEHTRVQPSVEKPAGYLIYALRTKMDVSVLRDAAKEIKFNQPCPPLPAADRPLGIDDPVWSEVVAQHAAAIPQLTQAVCLSAGDRYEIAVEGPMTYLPLSRHHAAIRAHLAQRAGHPVELVISVDSRLDADIAITCNEPATNHPDVVTEFNHPSPAAMDEDQMLHSIPSLEFA